MNELKRQTAPPGHRMYPRRPAALIRPRRTARSVRGAAVARVPVVDPSGPGGPLVPAGMSEA